MMNLLKSLFARLTNNHTVDGIVSTINTAVQRLHDLEQRKVAEIEAHYAAIREATLHAEAATAEKLRASNVKAKLLELVS